ncbi:MAG: cell division protein FtsZ [Candidatus Hydrothermarchaeota archaeon]
MGSKNVESEAKAQLSRERKETIEKELEELLKQAKANILVVGTGGAGCNTITRLLEMGIEGALTISVNTDSQDLLYSKSMKKMLIGRTVTGGLGAGSDPKIGEEAALESEREIRDALEGADMVFVTCGLGGGTGTGSAPIIANIAQKVGALTVAVVTLPFSVEGGVRLNNAHYGLEKLIKVVDTVIVIPNDRLLQVVPNLPLNAAFKVADEILARAVKGITELITKPGLINLDFADVRTVMEGGGVAMIGLGETDIQSGASTAVKKAIESPLLDVDISGAKGALINIVGGPKLTMKEAETVIDTVVSKLDPEAQVIWGAQIMDDMRDLIRVMLIVVGVESPQILGPGKEYIPPVERPSIDRYLDLDLI